MMNEQHFEELKKGLDEVSGFASDNGYSLTQILQRLDRIIELLEDRD